MYRTWSFKRRAAVEAIVIFGVAAILLTLFIVIEAFPHVVAFSQQHERWEIDELFLTSMVMSVATSIYAVRRLNDARAELVKRQRAELRAQSMALHDPLTGLPNRRKVSEQLAIALPRAQSEPLAVMMIDLNRFKATNDLHGHGAGDELLLGVGRRLTEAAGENALVARLGGDEFVVVLFGAPESEALLHRVQEISAVFDEPFTVREASVVSGASIGITRVDQDNLDPDTVLAHADAAMYRSKRGGLNGFCFFEAGMEEAAKRRAETEADLRIAVSEGRIEPFYQPLVKLTTGGIIGFEALARWRLEDGSLREPDEFIAIAEESGLISDLFFSVLDASVKSARRWPKEWRLAVNLSPRQFDDEWLVQRILRVLTSHGFAPGRLDIEITESALVADLPAARRLIDQLKAQGIHVSLDDFGTGYSSLRHLSELSFDKLKIDRSFTHDLATSHSSETIIRAITSMAHNLGLEVTIEGIETVENARAVAEFGCDVGQGYLYGPPAPTADAKPAPGETGEKHKSVALG